MACSVHDDGCWHGSVPRNVATPALGDGATDDFHAIQGALDANECVFLPRGLYLTSRTLQVHPGRTLIGVAKHLTRITSMDAGLAAMPRHPNPLRDANTAVLPVVEVLPNTASSAEGGPKVKATFLAFISISVWNTLNSTSALHFHADDGIYRKFAHLGLKFRSYMCSPREI